MKRQLGVSKKAFEQLGRVSQPPDFPADLAVDLPDIIGGEVGEAAVFEIGPELLDGVELGGVGWEPFDVPVGSGREPPADLAVPVGPSKIPQQDHRAPEVPVEVAEEAEDVRSPDVFPGMQGQIEGDAAPARGDHEGPHAGDFFVGPRAERQPRGASPEAPGAAEDRGHQKARFIQADQSGVEAGEFFFTRGQVWRSQWRMRRSFRSLAVR